MLKITSLSHTYHLLDYAACQRFVIGSVQQVGRVYQTLELGDSGGSFNNFIDFRDSLGGVLNLQARVEGYTGGTQLDIRFANAYFEFIRNPITMVPFKEPKRVPCEFRFWRLPLRAVPICCCLSSTIF